MSLFFCHLSLSLARCYSHGNRRVSFSIFGVFFFSFLLICYLVSLLLLVFLSRSLEYRTFCYTWPECAHSFGKSFWRVICTISVQPRYIHNFFIGLVANRVRSGFPWWRWCKKPFEFAMLSMCLCATWEFVCWCSDCCWTRCVCVHVRVSSLINVV